MFQNLQDDYTGYIISGHAEMATPGYDLVCCAVSAITQAALLGLNDHLPEKISYSIDEQGFLECFLEEDISEEDRLAANVIIRTMLLGLESIEAGYGEYLKVSMRRCNKCCSE